MTNIVIFHIFIVNVTTHCLHNKRMETIKEVINLISTSDNAVIAILVMLVFYLGWRLNVSEKKREDSDKEWLRIGAIVELKSLDTDKKLDEIKSIAEKILIRQSIKHGND